MSQNIEIKASVGDFNQIIDKLSSIESRHIGTLFQHDTFYKMPFAKFKVRRFSDGSSELIFYRRSSSKGPKKSKYYRFNLNKQVRQILRPVSRLWPKKGDVVKTRELFIYGETRIHLDQVEGLGEYIEFEVVLDKDDRSSLEYGQEKAKFLMKALGVKEHDLIKEAYVDLLSPMMRDIWQQKI